MKPFTASLAALVALTCLCLSGTAEAGGRAGNAPQSLYATTAWLRGAPAWAFGAEAHGRARPAITPSRYAAPDLRHGAPAIAAQAAWGGGSALVAEAARYVGWSNPTGFRGPWCKAFTNMVLREAGYHPGPSLRAIDALADGQRVSAPQPGDLAVMRGHVTFFAQWDGPDAFDGLGGNQGHAVRLSRFWRGAVIAWVRPR